MKEIRVIEDGEHELSEDGQTACIEIELVDVNEDEDGVSRRQSSVSILLLTRFAYSHCYSEPLISTSPNVTLL